MRKYLSYTQASQIGNRVEWSDKWVAILAKVSDLSKLFPRFVLWLIVFYIYSAFWESAIDEGFNQVDM